MKFFLYILLGLVVLLFMIVIHELGHYLMGKLLKFKIDEFSVGFGPKLLQKRKKNGEVISLRAVPLGGYCAFTGESNADGVSMEPHGVEVFNSDESAPPQPQQRDYLLFDEQKPWKRILVFIAGPLSNFLSAIIFCFIFCAVIGYAQPTVSEVFQTPDGGVYNSLISGDIILAVDGEEINVMNSYNALIASSKTGEAVALTILRNGEKIELPNIKKQQIIATDSNGKELNYEGFGFTSTLKYQRCDIGTSIAYSVPLTLKFSWMILGSFGDLITGQIAITSLSGPIGTVEMFADVAMQNWRNILIWLPLLASNLAIFNILPIPALDGSKVIFTAIEWIRKKPVNKKVENIIHFAGILLLFGFVILVDVIGLIMR